MCWENDVNQDDHSQVRFQRTDQWKPVYTWLETLEDTELVKSNDIADWLSANPDVRDDLYSRHSRYHLMHYIKKLHVKILKRKERKKVSVDFYIYNIMSLVLRATFAYSCLEFYWYAVVLLHFGVNFVL